MESSDNNVKECYKKVISSAIDSRNDGEVAECCQVFFTRRSKHHSKTHIGPITSIRVWCHYRSIKTEEDWNGYWKERIKREQPKVNEGNCKKRIKNLENDIELLSKRVMELEERIEEYQQEASKEKRTRCGNCGKWMKHK